MVTTRAWNGLISAPATTVLIALASSVGSALRISPRISWTANRIRNVMIRIPNTFQPLPLTSCWLRPNAENTRARSITMAGTSTAQIVIRNRPGTISRNRPTTMARPARIDAPATGQKTCQRGRHGLPDGQVDPAVPHVLGGFHQCRLDQEGRHEADQRAEDGADDMVAEVEQPLQDRGNQENARRYGDQVGGVRPVRPPGFAQYTRKWIHWRRIPPPGCVNTDSARLCPQCFATCIAAGRIGGGGW